MVRRNDVQNYASRGARAVGNRSLDITLADLAHNRNAHERFPPLFANFFYIYFLRVIQELSYAKIRDYGFIFLGNLPCRFYECPAATNASSLRVQMTVILVELCERVIVIV